MAKPPQLATVVPFPPGGREPAPGRLDWRAAFLAHRDRGGGRRDLLRLAFQHCHVMVYRTAHQITGDALEAEDVTQSVFELLTRKVDGLRDPSTIPGYLKGCAVRASLATLRSGRRRAARHSAAAALEGDSGGASAFVVAAVHQLLDHLSPEQRAALVLKHGGKHTHEEVAELMGVSSATARRRIDEARKILADLAEDDLGASLLAEIGGAP